MSTSLKLLYTKSNIFSLPKLFEFEIAKTVYFYKFNLLPKIFDNYFSYAKSCHSRTTRFSLNIGPKIWNSTSYNLKIMTFNKYKKHYKSVLLLNN